MSEVEFRCERRVAHVRLNRPDKLNAITPEMDRQLAAAWARINDDPEIWCVVLSATGDRAFCIGADMAELSKASSRVGLGGGLTGIGGPLVTLRKPLIAAVQGFCVGGGFELAMCADIIVAAENAEFGLPETKLGIIGECGVVHRVLRQLPHRIAMAIILTGERIKAPAAEQFGLINEIVPLSDLLAAAGRWAEQINASSPLANRAAKSAGLSRLGYPLETALMTRFEVIEDYANSADYQEAAAARAAGRKPVWTGR